MKTLGTDLIRVSFKKRFSEFKEKKDWFHVDWILERLLLSPWDWFTVQRIIVYFVTELIFMLLCMV